MLNEYQELITKHLDNDNVKVHINDLILVYKKQADLLASGESPFSPDLMDEVKEKEEELVMILKLLGE